MTENQLRPASEALWKRAHAVINDPRESRATQRGRPIQHIGCQLETRNMRTRRAQPRGERANLGTNKIKLSPGKFRNEKAPQNPSKTTRPGEDFSNSHRKTLRCNDGDDMKNAKPRYRKQTRTDERWRRLGGGDPQQHYPLL